MCDITICSYVPCKASWSVSWSAPSQVTLNYFIFVQPIQNRHANEVPRRKFKHLFMILQVVYGWQRCVGVWSISVGSGFEVLGRVDVISMICGVEISVVGPVLSAPKILVMGSTSSLVMGGFSVTRARDGCAALRCGELLVFPREPSVLGFVPARSQSLWMHLVASWHISLSYL